MSDIEGLKKHIAQAEEIRQKNTKLDKDIARYLLKRLRKRMLDLIHPKTKWHGKRGVQKKSKKARMVN